MWSVPIAVASVGTADQAVAAQDNAFVGTWTSTDHDGSNQELSITGSGKGALAVFYFDDSPTGACGGSPAHVVGAGTPDGDALTTYATLTCLPGGNVLRSRITFTYYYSPGTDTLIDESGVIWYRSN
jgi:hypothetical protein